MEIRFTTRINTMQHNSAGGARYGEKGALSPGRVEDRRAESADDQKIIRRMRRSCLSELDRGGRLFGFRQAQVSSATIDAMDRSIFRAAIPILIMSLFDGACHDAEQYRGKQKP
jgi:hypothetical protein